MAISPRSLRSDLYSYSYNECCDIPLVISVVASLVERSVARNHRISRNYMSAVAPGPRPSRILVFDGCEVPDMSVQSFLERIFRYTKAGPCVYVVAYVYMDRFCQNNPEFHITLMNVHRLLITSVMVASKYVEDMNYRNSYYARVGGLTTNEMNKLEVDFLFGMGFKCHVNLSVFESYCCHLEREVSIGGGYHIERTLRCAEELKSKQNQQIITAFNHMPRIMLYTPNLAN